MEGEEVADMSRMRYGALSCSSRGGRSRLVAVPSTTSLAALHGALRGRVHLAEDFDELPDDIAEAFGAR